MTDTITIPRALLEQALEALELVTEDYDDSAVGLEIDAIQALRAELAKPVERVEPITLDQFRAIANRTATTYRHRSDPEKSSYAFVDGSSLDDFWRKVREAIQPTSAWHDAPTEPGMWISDDFDCISTFNSDDLLAFKTNTEVRWYGPIPEDAKAKGVAA